MSAAPKQGTFHHPGTAKECPFPADPMDAGCGAARHDPQQSQNDQDFDKSDSGLSTLHTLSNCGALLLSERNFKKKESGARSQESGEKTVLRCVTIAGRSVEEGGAKGRSGWSYSNSGLGRYVRLGSCIPEGPFPFFGSESVLDLNLDRFGAGKFTLAGFSSCPIAPGIKRDHDCDSDTDPDSKPQLPAHSPQEQHSREKLHARHGYRLNRSYALNSFSPDS